MIKIDIKMPNNCGDCFMCVFAFDSELFKENERYCCLKIKSVEKVADTQRADFCPLIEE